MSIPVNLGGIGKRDRLSLNLLQVIGSNPIAGTDVSELISRPLLKLKGRGASPEGGYNSMGQSVRL